MRARPPVTEHANGEGPRRVGCDLSQYIRVRREVETIALPIIPVCLFVVLADGLVVQ